VRAPVVTFRRARSFRRELTLPEVLLWQLLRQHRTHGLRFRRQHPVGPYVLDFFCAAASLAVEIDGEGHQHPERAGHDRRRDVWLAQRGIRTLRIAAADLLRKDGLSDALDAIVQAAAPSTAFGGPPPP
jgi:very-short-patch-repair endonuclease